MRRVRDRMRGLRRQEGQSLTEFAIIAPVIVGIFIFAIYFYEATQIKLKQQEAERYVAWEFTGKLLTDYNNPGNSSSLFNQAKQDIVADAMERFDNLVSTNKLQNQRAYIMTEWELREPRVLNERVPEVPGNSWVNLVFQIFKWAWTVWDAQTFTSSNLLHQAMMWGSDTRPTFAGSGAIAEQFGPSGWGFNQKGFVQVKMRWRVAPTAMFTKRFMDNRFNTAFRPFGTVTLDDRAAENGIALVVDSWNLQDGTSIGGYYQRDKGTRYWKQVDRMAWVSSAPKTTAKLAALAITLPSQVIAIFNEQVAFPTIDPMETALAARAYGPTTDGKRRLEGMSDKPDTFDTAPFTPKSAYENAYKQRGQYFMGCRETGIVGCNRSLSSNNPFGEFIVTQE
ncbi:MAG: hypothetical protein HY906_07635 [Deltaproteobacteria bacterium]|nr:hypothetical protein [Deltaproteobacteria bacterium]